MSHLHPPPTLLKATNTTPIDPPVPSRCQGHMAKLAILHIKCLARVPESCYATARQLHSSSGDVAPPTFINQSGSAGQHHLVADHPNQLLYNHFHSGAPLPNPSRPS